MNVKLHNNQSPMGIRFCCISLEIVPRARWKWQDSATVQKARAGSDYTASLTKGIILPSTTLHYFSSTQQQMQKKTTPLTCSAWNLKQQDKLQRNLTCQYRSTLQSCFVAHNKSRTKNWVVPHYSYSFLGVGGPAEGCWSSLSTRGYVGLEWSWIRWSSYRTLEKILHPEHGWSQAAKRSGCSTKPVSAQWASGEYSQWSCLGLGSPARRRDLGSMILMGGFQLTIFQFYQSEQLSTKANRFNRNIPILSCCSSCIIFAS